MCIEETTVARFRDQRLQQLDVVLELRIWRPARNKLVAHQAVQPFTLCAAARTGPNSVQLAVSMWVEVSRDHG
jgi:hypothetical protein